MDNNALIYCCRRRSERPYGFRQFNGTTGDLGRILPIQKKKKNK